MDAVYLVRHGEPRRAFELRRASDPTPGPGQVRIAVEAFGLNYADVAARRGTYRDAPPVPCIIGYEVVGRIDAVGAEVTGLEAGQRVAALTRFGGYATRAVTDHRAVMPIPDDMDVGVAAALPTQGCTAYYCAEEMVHMHPGDHVLVHAAAGGVGTLLVQLAKHRGGYVYGTAGSEQKLEYLRQQGVDFPINYRAVDFAEAIRGVRGRDGLDVIFDSLGGSAVRKGMQLLAAGGRMVCLGAAQHEAGRLQLLRSLRFALSFGFPHPVALLLHSRSLLAVNMLRIADHRPQVLQRCLQKVLGLWRDGVLRPTVGGRFTADQLAQAHELLETRASVGKIAVSWS